MNWQQVREQYPHCWLLIEALEAHSAEGRRCLDELSVVETYADSGQAMADYLQRHRRAPDRELYVLHTDREELEIDERDWLGLRRAG